jgi:hypothetical protein
VRAGTSKGSSISQYGCSTFGALAIEALQQEEEEEGNDNLKAPILSADYVR